MERKKFCPVCGGLVAVWEGNREKYGERAVWNWHQFIRLKYCSDECRDIITRQGKRLSKKRRRKERREYRDALLDAVEVLRKENRLCRERIAKLEAGL